MKHAELHVHYLRQLVHEKVVSLLYCRRNDQVADIFTKSLFEWKFVKFRDLLRLQRAAIIGGCTDVISPLESPECCVDGGVLEPLVMLVQHNSGSSRDNQWSNRLA